MQRFMECDDIRVSISGVFPVIVYTIRTKEHQAVDHRFYIFEGTVTVFSCNDVHPFSGTDTGCPAFKKFDTAHNVGTVFVSCIYPSPGSREETVIPRAEQVGIVPHREDIVGKVSRRLTYGPVFTCTHGDIHPKVAFLVCIGDDAVAAVHNLGFTYVRTYKCNVGGKDTFGSEFFFCRVFASVYMCVVE